MELGRGGTRHTDGHVSQPDASRAHVTTSSTGRPRGSTPARACDRATWTNAPAPSWRLARKAFSANTTLSTDLLSPGFAQRSVDSSPEGARLDPVSKKTTPAIAPAAIAPAAIARISAVVLGYDDANRIGGQGVESTRWVVAYVRL